MAANVSLTLFVADRATSGTSRGSWWSFLRRAPRDSKHLALVKKTVPGVVIRASAEGLSCCVAMSDRELFVGRARWFGSRVDRYSLNRLLRLRRTANRSIDLLKMEFAGMPPSSLVVMYDVCERSDFAIIIARLQRRIAPLQPRSTTAQSRSGRTTSARNQRTQLRAV